jgi:hypothetical protein
VNLESVKHLRRSRTIAQELFNYISITFNKTEILSKTSKNKILEGISDIKKYENFSFFRKNHKKKNSSNRFAINCC